MAGRANPAVGFDGRQVVGRRRECGRRLRCFGRAQPPADEHPGAETGQDEERDQDDTICSHASFRAKRSIILNLQLSLWAQRKNRQGLPGCAWRSDELMVVVEFSPRGCIPAPPSPAGGYSWRQPAPNGNALRPVPKPFYASNIAADRNVRRPTPGGSGEMR